MSLSTEALIGHSAKHLAGLERSKQISDFAKENPGLVDQLTGEFDIAVTTLNNWLQDGHMLLWAPKAKILQPQLGFPPVRLPTIEQMRGDVKWVTPFNRGLREERRLLVTGERDKEDRLPGSEKILYSSFDNSNEAYVMGAIGHTWERTCVADLRKNPPTDYIWQKDDLLVPMEDVVVFLGELGENSVANIYRLMSTPPNPDRGGTGWITPERIVQTRELLDL